MTRLGGKVILVTGGASGLGHAVVRRLLSDGAAVIAADLQAFPGDNKNDREVGPSLLAVEHDVRDQAQWALLIETVTNRFGRLDGLVNNAGIVGPMDAATLDTARLSDWRRIFAVNVEGVFLGCQAALPVLAKAGSASIVNISSVAGLTATPHAVAYGASKAAVSQLTKSVAQHCAERGWPVRCNSVHPGDVHTPLWEQVAEEISDKRGLSTERLFAEREAAVPSGVLTEAADVAATVAFLLSDDARQINASELVIDGGLIGCSSFHIGASVAHRLGQKGDYR